MPHALRSAACPRGLPNFSGRDKVALDIGNQLEKFSRDVLETCLERDIPCAEENPSSSLLWKLKSRQRLLGKGFTDHPSFLHVPVQTCI